MIWQVFLILALGIGLLLSQTRIDLRGQLNPPPGDVSTTKNATFGPHVYDFMAATVLLPDSAISSANLNQFYSQLVTANEHAQGTMNGFSHSATFPGFRLKPQIGNPSTFFDGAIWYNSITPGFTARDGGATVQLATVVSQPPASSSATCKPSQMASDATFVYVCTSANTWKRATLTSW